MLQDVYKVVRWLTLSLEWVGRGTGSQILALTLVRTLFTPYSSCCRATRPSSVNQETRVQRVLVGQIRRYRGDKSGRERSSS